MSAAVAAKMRAIRAPAQPSAALTPMPVWLKARERRICADRPCEASLAEVEAWAGARVRAAAGACFGANVATRALVRRGVTADESWTTGGTRMSAAVAPHQAPPPRQRCSKCSRRQTPHCSPDRHRSSCEPICHRSTAQEPLRRRLRNPRRHQRRQRHNSHRHHRHFLRPTCYQPPCVQHLSPLRRAPRRLSGPWLLWAASLKRRRRSRDTRPLQTKTGRRLENAADRHSALVLPAAAELAAVDALAAAADARRFVVGVWSSFDWGSGCSEGMDRAEEALPGW
eukprot:4473306-Pleurochrysis_carterae.AAC.2